jgi:apolipoprotein D and lipocalin family protein
MKILLMMILLLLPLQAETLKPVDYVDPKKFSGLWYETARLYNSYQEDCVASTVEYVLQDDNEYEVYNRCFEKRIGGELVAYEGSAKSPLEPSNMSQIDMTYYWFFTKRYGVYYLDETYESAIVANEAFDQLWILSRKPNIETEKLEKILALLDNTIDLKKLIFTPQDGKGRYK